MKSSAFDNVVSIFGLKCCCLILYIDLFDDIMTNALVANNFVEDSFTIMFYIVLFEFLIKHFMDLMIEINFPQSTTDANHIECV